MRRARKAKGVPDRELGGMGSGIAEEAEAEKEDQGRLLRGKIRTLV